MNRWNGDPARSVPAPRRWLDRHDLRVGVGVVLAISALLIVGAATHASLLIAPFAATAALKHAAPHAALARPRAVLGGYLIGAIVGFGIGSLAPGMGIGAAAAAGIAAMLMVRLDVEHPPAVAMAVLAVQVPVPWVLQVTAAGALTITASTVVLSPLLHRHTYPVPHDC
jgi:CBS-domain-containing membrane protein